MEFSNNGLDLLASLEGLKLKAYKDSGNIWTIGIGTIKYPDGSNVKENDVCTKIQAYSYCNNDIKAFVKAINVLLKTTLNQNQFDALVIFTYNVGINALKSSTLLKRINLDKFNPLIKAEFLKWNKVKGVPVTGLTNRRKIESNLYFS